jgi:Molybdopterin converting factor, small subunit
MKIRAEFFSRLREIVGQPVLEISLPDGATVNDLARELLRDYPKLSDFQQSMLFGVGVEFVPKNQPLRNGDTVAIMPPVQGG